MAETMGMIEQTFRSWDGAEIFYRAWLPPKPAARTLLLFHRGHEHSARWQQTAEALAADDGAIFAWDQRGHGRSDGDRGHAPNLAAITKDADHFARHLAREHGVDLRQTMLIAHSIGATVAAAWVHDFAPPIRGMVLAAPALRVKLYVPLAIPLLRLKQKIFGPGEVKSYVKATMLTHDPEQAREYQRDPLIFRQIAVNMLLDLNDASTRLLKDAAAITAPTLILAAGKDWIVKVSAQKEFFRRLGSPVKQFHLFPGLYHSLFQETDRPLVIQRIRTFIDECFARPPQLDGQLNSDLGGFTRTEYDLLQTPSRFHWRLTRAAMKTGGRISRGIRLGLKSGFDSGATLDYVYENKPAGATPVGKLVDYFYLNSIGWRGIRVRRENLQKVLRRCMDELNHAGRPIRLLDIASGPGRYILETMRGAQPINASAVLRDYKQENLDAAAVLAAQFDIKNVTTFLGDAFDRDSLGATQPRPTIAIVSGLYELFPDNAPVRCSLDGLAAAVEQGGYLIYTGQPWHPQVEFIARVLTNREGRPWIMRRRAQAEMDALVHAAGFEKISQEIDPWGIFTVSVARRGAS